MNNLFTFTFCFYRNDEQQVKHVHFGKDSENASLKMGFTVSDNREDKEQLLDLIDSHREHLEEKYECIHDSYDGGDGAFFGFTTYELTLDSVLKLMEEWQEIFELYCYDVGEIQILELDID